MAETKPKPFKSEILEEVIYLVHEAVCTHTTADSVEEDAAQIEATGHIVAAMIVRGRV